MNRKQIAEALGVSEKTVSRYIASGRLPDRRIGGALDVLPSDVEQLKAELETPVEAPGHGETTGDKSALARVSASSTKPLMNPPKHDLTLESLAQAVVTIGARLDAGQGETRQDKPHVPTAAKLLLSLDEAAALTGLSATRLRAAIAAGTLKATRIGRGWKMRRVDLEAWVNSMLE